MAQPKLRMPHPLVLLVGCILLASVATYLMPAGDFDRIVDENGRTRVVAGTYQEVESTPVGLFAALVAIPRGMIAQGEVIFLVFLIGGAFSVVDETGALRRATSALVRTLKGQDVWVIPIVAFFFAIGGIVQNMQEEIIPLIPVLVILTARLGFKPLVAVAMSAGAAFVGSAFSPMNPFQVLIAQGVAELPLASGWQFRTVFLVLALVLWIAMTMRFATSTRSEPDDSVEVDDSRLTGIDKTILLLVLATFGMMVYGLSALGWFFNEMSAGFFIMGIVVGLLAGMGLGGTAEAYARGFAQMAYAALLIGFARTILVVLEDGHVVDTMVYALFTPLEELPRLASAFGMIVAQAAIHVPIPSVSSQAVLTMPVLVPLSDLLQIEPQITVLAYQYGAGLCDLVTPTNGALMAMLAAAGVRYEDWMKFTFPLYGALVALGAVSIAIGMATGLQ